MSMLQCMTPLTLFQSEMTFKLFHTIAEADKDFSQVPQYSVLEESQIRAPAAQILLVCCWRTMKEVALLLGELAENAPIQVGNSRHILLTAEQVI